MRPELATALLHVVRRFLRDALRDGCLADISHTTELFFGLSGLLPDAEELSGEWRIGTECDQIILNMAPDIVRFHGIHRRGSLQRRAAVHALATLTKLIAYSYLSEEWWECIKDVVRDAYSDGPDGSETRKEAVGMLRLLKKTVGDLPRSASHHVSV